MSTTIDREAQRDLVRRKRDRQAEHKANRGAKRHEANANRARKARWEADLWEAELAEARNELAATHGLVIR